MSKLDLTSYIDAVSSFPQAKVIGRVTQVVGLTIEVRGLQAFVGEMCLIYVNPKAEPVTAEVVGFKNGHVLMMPLGDLRGIGPGCEVLPTGREFTVKAGPHLLGHVLDGLGIPLDGARINGAGKVCSVDNDPPNPLERQRINEVLPTGIRAIDMFLTCGQGQRIGIFSGSGVGKSTMLGMIAKHSEADINVIALIGERGREVVDFIERDLGEEGLARSVVVAVTSDRPPLLRIKGALVATAIAEYFRDQGKKVMLMMDSVTRLAMAQREVGLAIGEPPTTKGYTPSVFALLPRVLERAGTSRSGSITGLYTVLVDGDDFNEPVADAVRGILDGHIVLTRDLAAKNHFPAIDISKSISRLMTELAGEEHRKLAGQFRDYLSAYAEAEDLINIGAYVEGTNPRVDRARQYITAMNSFLKQDVDECEPFEQAVEKLKSLFMKE
ncbi:flagellar protein export ATPase FliI [Dethiobacter alkaliphilus]|uniref:flagellar protein export ATPase FliI n=1 Tax=Dethiobacter alkaliphilus TaxID=427926 RepID=UPI002225D980|nr:flagellar protein export ATPase FliI [Dethiobacter alkaliphilus]MCW3488745.1 flagellar protein export ATPase FliI [Dethiobacter alkaliphilus]